MRAALILFEGLPSASVMNMPGAELAAKYGPQIRSIASRTGESPAAIIGLLTGAAIGVELLKPDYDDVKGTDLSQGNLWGSSDLGDPEPDPKVPLIAPPLDEQVGIRDGQAVYKDSLTGAEYVTDLYGNRVPTAVDTEVPGVGRFNNVQARDANEAQFLANVEATLSNSATWAGITRHRGELVIQRSDIELSPENITLMKNGQAPFVRGANGDWEQVQLHHVGRETGQMIEVTRSQNSYNSATGGPLHIPGPGGPVRQPGFSQSYWQERYQNLVNSGQIAP